MSLLARRPIISAGDVSLIDTWSSSHVLPTGDDGLVVASDVDGVVGAYQLHVRSAGSGHEAELLYFGVAARARRGVDRVLLDHLGERAALTGLTCVQLTVRPPVDVYFSRLGARAVGLEAPWGCGTGPGIRLALPVPWTQTPPPDEAGSDPGPTAGAAVRLARTTGDTGGSRGRGPRAQ